MQLIATLLAINKNVWTFINLLMYAYKIVCRKSTLINQKLLAYI